MVDGHTTEVHLPTGSTVQKAIMDAKIVLNALDRVEPPAYTVLTDQAIIRVIRVRESFDVSQSAVSFEHQVVKNESLPEGEILLVQPGVNGLQEITHRHLSEDGKEVSDTIFKTTVLKDPVPEIMMVGVQTPISVMAISGRLIYLTGGNAWMMEETTGKRAPLVTSGDLDGHIFTLSPDGAWLLFSRKAPEADDSYLNSLWVIQCSKTDAKPIDLKVENVIQFADWVPDQKYTITYSTVEPRSSAPGWQANNDLHSLSLSPTGSVSAAKEILSSSSGGIYGWWGTSFAWSPDGKSIAYARPDSIGLVDLKKKEFIARQSYPPLQTHADWAWVPGFAWSSDGKNLLSVTHAASSSASSAEESPAFDLFSLPTESDAVAALVNGSGMFANPRPSPIQEDGSYQIAYLQALFPDQSEDSRYRLFTIDQDGSNRVSLFPAEGAPGLEPQIVAWSPRSIEGQYFVAFIYQGNLWFASSDGKQVQQVTGDGTISRLEWK